MDEEALKYSFDLFVKDGYKDSFDDYKKLISTDKDALEYSHKLFVNDGYKDGIEDYKTLIGVGGTNPAEKKNVTASNGGDTSSDLLSIKFGGDQYQVNPKTQEVFMGGKRVTVPQNIKDYIAKNMLGVKSNVPKYQAAPAAPDWAAGTGTNDQATIAAAQPAIEQQGTEITPDVKAILQKNFVDTDIFDYGKNAPLLEQTVKDLSDYTGIDVDLKYPETLDKAIGQAKTLRDAGEFKKLAKSAGVTEQKALDIAYDNAADKFLDSEDKELWALTKQVNQAFRNSDKATVDKLMPVWEKARKQFIDTRNDKIVSLHNMIITGKNIDGVPLTSATIEDLKKEKNLLTKQLNGFFKSPEAVANDMVADTPMLSVFDKQLKDKTGQQKLETIAKPMLARYFLLGKKMGVKTEDIMGEGNARKMQTDKTYLDDVKNYMGWGDYDGEVTKNDRLEFLDLHNKLGIIMPMLLINKIPVQDEEDKPVDILIKSGLSMTPALATMNQTGQQKTNTLNDILAMANITSDDLTEDALTSINTKMKKYGWTQDLAQMGGSTISIIAPMMLAEAGAGFAIESLALNPRTATIANFLLKNPIGKVVKGGATYSLGGTIAGGDGSNELDFGTGGAAGTVDVVLDALGSKNKAMAKWFISTFGKRATKFAAIAAKPIAKGVGEFFQESGETIYQAWRDTPEGKSVMDTLQQQFPDADSQLKFFVGTVIMGGGMGLAGDIGFSGAKKRAYDALSPENKAKANAFMATRNQKAKDAVDEAVPVASNDAIENNLKGVKEAKEKLEKLANRDVEAEDKVIADFQQRTGYEPTLVEDVPKSIDTTLSRIDNGLPVDQTAKDELADWAYEQYKKLSLLKKSDARKATTAQIQQAQDYLEGIITNINDEITAKKIEAEKDTEGTTPYSIEVNGVTYSGSTPQELQADIDFLEHTENTANDELYKRNTGQTETPPIAEADQTDVEQPKPEAGVGVEGEKRRIQDRINKLQAAANQDVAEILEDSEPGELRRLKKQLADLNAAETANKAQAAPTFENVPVFTYTPQDVEKAKNEVFDNLSKLQVGSVIENSDGEIKVVTENSTSKKGKTLIGVVTFIRLEDGSLRQMGDPVFTSKSEDGKINLDYNPHATARNAKGEQVTVSDQITDKTIDLSKENIFIEDENGNLVKTNAFSTTTTQTAPTTTAAKTEPSDTANLPQDVQDKIAYLRAQEQVDLEAAIPNIEEYKVNGVIDKAKIENSPDGAAYKKIYDQYNAPITALVESGKNQPQGGEVKETVSEKQVPKTISVEEGNISSPEEFDKLEKFYKEEERKAGSEYPQLSYKEEFIHKNIGRVDAQQLIDAVGEKVFKDDKMALRYTKKGAQKIDDAAMELSEMSGVEITPQDIFDYFLDRTAFGGRYVKQKVKRYADVKKGLDKIEKQSPEIQNKILDLSDEGKFADNLDINSPDVLAAAEFLFDGEDLALIKEELNRLQLPQNESERNQLRQSLQAKRKFQSNLRTGEGTEIEGTSETTPTEKVEAEPTADIDNVADKAGIAPKNLRDLYNINRTLFGLNKVKSLAAAVAMDRMVGVMAKRAGIAKAEMYARLEFKKDTEANVLKADNALFQGTVNGENVTLRNTDVDVVNGFYSPLRKIIAEAKQDKMPAKQWAEKFARGEEAKWTGLTDWLAAQQGSVSKQDILDYLKNNRISIVEVVKEDAKSTDDFTEQEQVDDIYNSTREELGRRGVLNDIDENPNNPLEDFYNNPNQETYSELVDFADGYGVTVEQIDFRRQGNVPDVKFSQYQLEGDKSNYKEVLVTLPSTRKKVEPLTELPDEYEFITDGKRIGVIPKTQGFAKTLNGYFDTEQEALDNALSLINSNRQAKADREIKDFKSSHFDEPNILVHLRMNTRTDAEGNKVLFLEEVQSDWGQKGKKEGFDDKDLEKKRSALLDEMYALEMQQNDNITTKKVANTGTISDFEVSYKNEKLKEDLDKKINSLRAEVDKINKQTGITPTAPFVTDTNAWVKLGLKVAMKEAVAQGADKIAWTTGEQQNDRYDLSKQVDKIDVEAVEDVDNLFFVDISLSNGTTENLEVENGIIREGNYKGQRLDSVIGKDYADKIMSTPKGESVTLQGADLKVGGKGMKGFYGSPTEGSLGIVGNAAKSLFKQDVGTVKIINKSDDPFTAKYDPMDELLLPNGYEYRKAPNYTWEIVKDNKVVGSGDTKNDARGDAIFTNNMQLGTKVVSTQNSITITPELRTQVQNGLALFQKQQGQNAKGAMVAADGKFIIYALTDPNVSTPLHEVAHVFEHYLTDGERATINNWAKTGAWTTETSEKFARGFEKYLSEGIAPTEGLKKVFEKFKTWLTDIYNGIKGSDIDIELNDDMRSIYAKMLGEDAVPAKKAKAAKAKTTKPAIPSETIDKLVGKATDRRAAVEAIAEENIKEVAKAVTDTKVIDKVMDAIDNNDQLLADLEKKLGMKKICKVF